MDEVIALLAGDASAPSVVTPPPAGVTRAPAKSGGGGRGPLIAAGAAVVLLAAGGAGWWLWAPKTTTAPVITPPSTGPIVATNAEAARGAIEAALGRVPCSWLGVAGATSQGAGVAIKLSGVAASPQAADAAVLQASQTSGVKSPDVDLLDVLPAAAPMCGVLDAFRPIRAAVSAGGGRLSTSQARYTLEKQADGSMQQKAVITMAIRDPSLDFAIFGLEQTGDVSVISADRATFVGLQKGERSKGNIQDLGDDSYRLSILSTLPGLDGVLLITGHGPFDPNLIGLSRNQRGADWSGRVKAAAEAKGWKAEMVWYRMEGAAGP